MVYSDEDGARVMASIIDPCFMEHRPESRSKQRVWDWLMNHSGVGLSEVALNMLCSARGKDDVQMLLEVWTGRGSESYADNDGEYTVDILGDDYVVGISHWWEYVEGIAQLYRHNAHYNKARMIIVMWGRARHDVVSRACTAARDALVLPVCRELGHRVHRSPQ